jgi:hypothetical protein
VWAVTLVIAICAAVLGLALTAAADSEVTAQRTDSAGNTTTYTGTSGLVAALNAANSGDTVVMLKDQTLSEDVTVPEDVFLLLPCVEGDVGYDPDDGYAPDGDDDYLNRDHVKCYGTLTIASGATLTVNGKVLVNAVIGTDGQTSGVDQGQISGGYAAIEMAGNIVISDGGYMENFGLVSGDGQITVNSGATLVDRYVLVHWRGGTQASNIVGENVYPMNEIDCHSITSNILIHSGGKFWGAVKVQADGRYTNARFPQIDNDNGMIRLSKDATVLKTYQDGRSTLTISGGASFASSKLEIVRGIKLTTADYLFPVDGDIGFVLKNGTYEVKNDFKLMPGCTVDVASDASVKVNSGVTLVAYDKFNDVKNTDDTQYPANRDPATLTLHGGAAMEVSGTFAGRLVLADDVTDESYARVRFANSATTTVTTKESNGLIDTAIKNGDPKTVSLTFNAELWNSSSAQEGLTALPARTYYGASDGWSLTNPVSGGLPGDADGDGLVDSRDLFLVIEYYAQDVKTGKNGDVSNDGVVDSRDLFIVIENY